MSQLSSWCINKNVIMLMHRNRYIHTKTIVQNNMWKVIATQNLKTESLHTKTRLRMSEPWIRMILETNFFNTLRKDITFQNLVLKKFCWNLLGCLYCLRCIYTVQKQLTILKVSYGRSYICGRKASLRKTDQPLFVKLVLNKANNTWNMQSRSDSELKLFFRN